jgi:hypothetical protein
MTEQLVHIQNINIGIHQPTHTMSLLGICQLLAMLCLRKSLHFKEKNVPRISDV